MAARMRYATEALELIREADPGTPVTLNHIRALAASGKIPVHKIGRRRLINVDALMEYLAGQAANKAGELGIGQIRPVQEGGTGSWRR